MTMLSQPRVILHNAVTVGLSHYYACYIVSIQQAAHGVEVSRTVSRCRHLHEVYAMIMSIGFNDTQHGRLQRFRHQHTVTFLGRGHTHHHGFGRSSRTIVHGCIRHVKSGESCHHRLVFENILQRALRNLGLIRRVRGRKLTALRNVGDDRRGVVVVGTSAGKGDKRFVGCSHVTYNLTHLHLALGRRNVEFAVQFQFFRYLGVEFVE